MEYFRFSKGKANYQLVPSDVDLDTLMTDRSKEYFKSIYKYNEDHYKYFQEKGTIAGIRDVKTNSLVWDLDSEDVESARKDAVELSSRLMSKGVAMEDIRICFSGKKGFSVELVTDKEFTVEEFRAITKGLAHDLATFDPVVSDPARLLRVPFSKHSSGLFKTPFQVEELTKYSIDEIKEFSKDYDQQLVKQVKASWKTVALPEAIYLLKNQAVEIKPRPVTQIMDVSELDFSTKIKGITNCRWAIMQGFYSERTNALLALCAALRALKYPNEIAYGMLKSSARLQSQRLGTDPLPKKEIWAIVDQVYRETWQGGQYTCKHAGSWLYNYCQSLGDHKCNHEDKSQLTLSTNEIFGVFNKYAKDFDKNVLFTGIKELDQHAKLLVSTSNGLLGGPGQGKTSVALSILKHNSQIGNQGLLFSYDMSNVTLFSRMLQKECGFSQDKIYEMVKNGDPRLEEILRKVDNSYKKVKFCFKNGQTIDDMVETIKKTEDDTSEKVRLVVVDYNELIASELSDSTASSAQIAQKLRQMASEQEVAVLTLLQPNKHNATPGEEHGSFNAVKGSSAIAQSLTLMLGCSRPGFSAREPENDRYFSISALKNRNGPLFAVDLGWDGIRGNIYSLSEEEKNDLRMLRERKAKEEAGDGGW